MFWLIFPGVMFLVAAMFYWIVCPPLGKLPTLEDLRLAGETNEKNSKSDQVD